jgi:hypothetical protein
MHERVLLRCPVAPGQGRLEERKALESLAVLCSERERGGATSGVADNMETVETANVSLPENPLDLGLETEIRRWLGACVNLEILSDRVDPLSEALQQLSVCKPSG